MSEPQAETPQSHLTVGERGEVPTPQSQAPTPQSTDKDGSGDHEGENPFDIELTEVLARII